MIKTTKLRIVILSFFFIMISYHLHAEIKCKKCNFENDNSDRYCLECASELRQISKAEKEKLEKDNQINKIRSKALAQKLKRRNAFNFLSDNLINLNGQKYNHKTLSNKIIGLYFSAHWCGPCRRFTPKLVQFRNKFKDKFEVVFISYDKTEQDQLKYMRKFNMKWPACHIDAGIAKTLKKQYVPKGIPTLVILSRDGALITKKGRGKVERFPEVFPAEWD